jgi:AcrR family transcriptional regulator
MGSGKITASRLSARPARGAVAAASPFRSALIDLCFERGFAQLTVAELCRRAGVAPAAFRRRHADLEDCFFDVCRAELRRYRRRAFSARAGQGEWRARLRATTYALYRFLDEDERLRRFALIEARAAGERPALLIGAELEALYELIDEGRSEPSAPPSLTRATAESLGGGIFTQLYHAAAHQGPLPPEAEFVPVMMYAAVLPYLGAAAASEELAIAPPPLPRSPAGAERGQPGAPSG